MADSFHVKPLLRIIQSADAHHVLTLNRREIRLFEGNRDVLAEIDLMPGARTISEALGDELTEPHLTVASYAGARSLAQRHGQGSKNDEIDVDTERYFRAVDRSILEQYSRPSGRTLILAALSEYHAPFHNVSQNPYLLTEGIEINPDALSSGALCAHAWRAVEPRYLARLAQLVERFGAARGANRGEESLPHIAAGAVAGGVATILIEADRVVPGRIESESGGITFGSLDRPDMDDVLDDLGELVLRMGGEVVVVPAVACLSRQERPPSIASDSTTKSQAAASARDVIHAAQERRRDESVPSPTRRTCDGEHAFASVESHVSQCAHEDDLDS